MFIFKTLNNYSIDVALGAMASSWYFGYLLNVHVSAITLLVLGLSVWSIYTFDHLIDARNLSSGDNSERHRLHHHHKKVLSTILIVVLCALAILVLYIPTNTVVFGVSVALGVIVYFIAMNLLKVKFGYYKEILVAIIYTIGVLVAPLSLNPLLEPMHYLIIGTFTLLAFLNLIIFSWYEQAMDKSHNFPSLVLSIGSEKTFWLLRISFLGLCLLSLCIFLKGNIMHGILFAAMTGLLGIILFKPSIFRKHLAYRIVGDGVFLLPVLCML